VADSNPGCIDPRPVLPSERVRTRFTFLVSIGRLSRLTRGRLPRRQPIAVVANSVRKTGPAPAERCSRSWSGT